MDELLCLTVYFEDPFWVGIVERSGGGQLRVCRVVFGAEPSDADVYQWILSHWQELRFSPAVAHTARAEHSNPKRLQRETRKAVQDRGVGTRSQQALQAQREAQKVGRQTAARARREEEAAQRFARKQQKRREKHRGH